MTLQLNRRAVSLISLAVLALFAAPAAHGWADEKAQQSDQPAQRAKSEKSEADGKKDADKSQDEKKSKEKASKEKAAEVKVETADSKAKKQVKAEAKKLRIAAFRLSQRFPEGPAIGGAFGDLAPRLVKLVERIDQAAGDKNVSGIVLRIDSPGLGRGKVGELRAAIERARKAGKKVYAELHEASGADYMLATACDEIVMPPAGTLSITGVRAEVMFYKGLFDKLGLKADMLQVGDYKGAAEPMMRKRMSPEFRKQLESVIDDFYQQMVATIARERRLDRSRVRELIDEGLLTAVAAKEAGLIDRVAYADDFRKALADEHKTDDVTLVDDYGTKPIDDDFSGLGGLVKLMELFAGSDGKTTSSRTKKVAVVYVVGAIVTGKGGGGLMGETVGSDTVIKALRKADEDDSVVGIVLRVDSPGGSAAASDLIWHEIRRIEKPVVASMGDTAASGGYYISMAADKILAEPGTLTGSIGVVGGKVAVKGLLDKLGVTTEVVARGKNSGWSSMDEPFTDSERKVVTALMQDIYKQFTEKAAKCRGIGLEEVEALAGGRVYSGRMAVDNKLVDELGTLEDAIAEVKRRAGLKKDDKIERMMLPEPKSIFEELFGGGLLANSGVQSAMPEEILTPLREAQTLRRLFDKPAVLVMPHVIRIK